MMDEPLQECLLMLAVFRGCIETKMIPGKDGPCARKVEELIARYDTKGEFTPESDGIDLVTGAENLKLNT